MKTALAAGLAALAVLAGCTGTPLPQPRPLPAGTSPTPATPAAPTGTRLTDRSSIPQGFLPHDELANEVGVDRSAGQPCFGQPQTVGWLYRRVGPTNIQHRLYVYPDERAAAEVLAELRDRLRLCAGWADAPYLVAPVSPRWGDEAIAVTLAKPADGAGEDTGARVRSVAVRVGRVIARFEGYPEVPAIDADAQAVVGRLCWFNANCRPRAGLPRRWPDSAAVTGSGSRC